MERATRVLVVDDHALVRSGVRNQLTGHVQIVGESDDAAPADPDLDVLTTREVEVLTLIALYTSDVPVSAAAHNPPGRAADL